MVKEITKSLGQTFYKLEGDVDPFIRADLHLIKKRTEAKAKEVVPAAVNEERNIVIEDGVKEEPLPPALAGKRPESSGPKKLTPKEEELVEAYNVKKMNKKERVKHQARKEGKAEAEQINKELDKRRIQNKRIDNKEARENRMLERALN